MTTCVRCGQGASTYYVAGGEAFHKGCWDEIADIHIAIRTIERHINPDELPKYCALNVLAGLEAESARRAVTAP